MKVQVYKCRFTKNIFEDRKKFRLHLKKLRKQQKEKRALNNMYKNRDRIFREMRESVKSIKELEQYIRDNWIEFCRNMNLYESTQWGGLRVLPEDKFPSLRNIKIDVVYSNLVSNSHSCPFDGITNWHRDKNLPVGYPGWTGRIEYEMDFGGQKNKISFGSGLFIKSGINTGTGGGGREKYSYDVRIYAADWPGLAQQISFNILKYNRAIPNVIREEDLV